MNSILAVDIGTTSAKALVVTEKGEVLATAQEFYPTRHPQVGYAEQDPEEIYQAVRKIIRLASSQTAEPVAGVSFSSAMHSIMAVDDKGIAITPMIIWADLRSKNEAREIIAADGQKIYEETGTPIHAMSPLCKLKWLKKNEPGLFNRSHKFIGIKEYIFQKLLNEFVVDHSIASASGLLNTSTRTWSTKALAAAGVSPAQLSTPHSIYDKFRQRNNEQISDLGLPKGVPWILGAGDGCLANLGSGAMDDKTLSLTIGTSGAVRKAVKKNSPDPEGRIFHYLLDEETLITGGATNNGAILVQWFSENFLKEKVNTSTFGERASSISAGSNGLIFLPYVLGERAPVFDPESTGVFFGVRKLHTQEHFMRAILEGVGYALFSVAEIVGKNSGGYDKVIASGGFIKSAHWVQLIADIFGKEFRVRGKEDASALGAALVGFKALGIKTDFQFPSEKVFAPDPKNHRKYQAYFSVYKNLYPHLSDDFQSLEQVETSLR